MLAGALAGCGQAPVSPAAAGNTALSAPVPRALELQSRPIGRGPRFQPPPRGPLLGRCRRVLGPRFGIHLEVFAADRVVIVPRGIGVRGPLRFNEGRIAGARCYGSLVTLEPTGVVLVAAGTRLSVSDLMRTWGEPLARYPRAFLDGRPWHGAAGAIALSRHAEIVLEAGPYVPPHRAYEFPPGA